MANEKPYEQSPENKNYMSFLKAQADFIKLKTTIKNITKRSNQNRANLKRFILKEIKNEKNPNNVNKLLLWERKFNSRKNKKTRQSNTRQSNTKGTREEVCIVA